MTALAEPPQTHADAPFPGAVEQGNGLVTFTIWAPHKKSVAIVGDFNAWDRAADPLACNEHGLWTLAQQLAPGRYRYQFCIDGDLMICDPYAKEVVNELEHPPQAVIEVGKEPYDWRHDGWQRPRFEDLILYELHVADYSTEGTFQAVIDHLDYLGKMGVNAIQLMPVNEALLDEDWGYQPTYYFATRNDYGTEDELRELVDEAHGRGLAVILDAVFAHTAARHPFNAMYPYEHSPWYGQGIGGKNDYGLPTFDHRKDPARAFCRDVQNHYLREYHVDGFRYDYAINIGADGDHGVPFLVREARATRADAYLIGEWVPENTKAPGLCGLDACWHNRSTHCFKALARHAKVWDFDYADFDKLIRFLDHRHQDYGSCREMLNYIESHDEARLIHELRDDKLGPEEARRRAMLMATVLLTAPGVPMLYHGQEYGETAPQAPNERSPLRWASLATKGGKALFEHYVALCRLRADRPALRAQGFAFDAIDAERKLCVYHRWDGGGDVVVVAANFSDQAHKLAIPFPETGDWREVFTDQTHGVGREMQHELPPHAAAVFVKA